MKVNPKIKESIERQRKLCEGCKVDSIQLSDGSFYASRFKHSCFDRVRKSIRLSNVGTRFKTSCYIEETDIHSFIIYFYDGVERIKVQVFPNMIDRVHYKQ